MLHYMLDRKKKNIILPYSELITKVLVYTGYDLEEKERGIMHLKIGKGVYGKLGYIIQGR